MNKKTVYEIFDTLSATIHNPTTELYCNSNFELLIAVILSARTTDKTVNKIVDNLFKIANTPEEILKLKITSLKKQVKSSGFFNTKAKNIIATCNILVKKFGSKVPQRREDLESLPGVGRKTANVILNIAFGQPTIAVDTHVFRVANRTGLAAGKTPKEIEDKLLKIVPKKFGATAGSLLLLHGRYTCISQKPKCSVCAIRKYCSHYKAKGNNLMVK